MFSFHHVPEQYKWQIQRTVLMLFKDWICQCSFVGVFNFKLLLTIVGNSLPQLPVCNKLQEAHRCFDTFQLDFSLFLRITVMIKALLELELLFASIEHYTGCWDSSIWIILENVLHNQCTCFKIFLWGIFLSKWF